MREDLPVESRSPTLFLGRAWLTARQQPCAGGGGQGLLVWGSSPCVTPSCPKLCFVAMPLKKPVTNAVFSATLWLFRVPSSSASARPLPRADSLSFSAVGSSMTCEIRSSWSVSDSTADLLLTCGHEGVVGTR